MRPVLGRGPEPAQRRPPSTVHMTCTSVRPFCGVPPLSVRPPSRVCRYRNHELLQLPTMRNGGLSAGHRQQLHPLCCRTTHLGTVVKWGNGIVRWVVEASIQAEAHLDMCLADCPDRCPHTTPPTPGGYVDSLNEPLDPGASTIQAVWPQQQTRGCPDPNTCREGNGFLGEGRRPRIGQH